MLLSDYKKLMSLSPKSFWARMRPRDTNGRFISTKGITCQL
jgi:hypothetical protein